MATSCGILRHSSFHHYSFSSLPLRKRCLITAFVAWRQPSITQILWDVRACSSQEKQPFNRQESAPSPELALGMKITSRSVSLAPSRNMLMAQAIGFSEGKAWPVLYGVSQWIVSRVLKTRRGYQITDPWALPSAKILPITWLI